MMGTSFEPLVLEARSGGIFKHTAQVIKGACDTSGS
jgi:hypothetical protein